MSFDTPSHRTRSGPRLPTSAYCRAASHCPVLHGPRGGCALIQRERYWRGVRSARNAKPSTLNPKPQTLNCNYICILARRAQREKRSSKALTAVVHLGVLDKILARAAASSCALLVMHSWRYCVLSL
jgi:hypothetical protein